MKTHFRARLSAIAILATALFCFSCEPAAPSGEQPQTPPEIPPEIPTREKGNYTPNRNLVAPLQTEYFDFYNRNRPFPFSREALAQMEITNMVMTQYTIGDNEILLESDGESGLIPARRVESAFNNNGAPLSMAYQSMIVGKVADSARLNFSYRADGKVEGINIETPDGNTTATYSFESDRLVRFENPGGLSVSYQQDTENGFDYETHYDKDGGGTVMVQGPVGSFTDEVCLELQEEILTRASSFVDYTHAPSLKEILFTEEEEGHPTRRVEMAALGEIKGSFAFTYRDEEVLGLIQYNDFSKGGLNTETRFTYNEYGDLTKVTFNENNPDANNLTLVQKFEYDDRGRLVKRIRSKKVGIGSLSLDRIDFINYP